MQIIDIYTHIFPDAFYQAFTKAAPQLGPIGARLRGVKPIYDLDLRFREMDVAGEGYCQIISLPNPPVEDVAPKETISELCRVANEAMAELCRKHPDRFPAFVAAINLADPQEGVKEGRRAVKELGARGWQIFTNIAGRPLDHADYEPVFAMAAELDLPLWLHPARTAADMPDYKSEKKSRYEMWWCFGWPYETSVAMCRLVFWGLFDRYPGIKIVTHHCGGFIPFYDGRVGPGLEVLGSRTADEDYSKVLPSLKKPHLEYFKLFYGDTAMFGGTSWFGTGYEFFGAEHIVFATDAPLGPIKSTIDALRGQGLRQAELDKILSGNARRLMKL